MEIFPIHHGKMTSHYLTFLLFRIEPDNNKNKGKREKGVESRPNNTDHEPITRRPTQKMTSGPLKKDTPKVERITFLVSQK